MQPEKTKKSNNTATIIFAALVIILLTYLCSRPKEPISEEQQTVKASKSDVLSAIKREPKVLDAVITDVNVLYVGVLDDGTRRDGYAEYLCQVLKDNNSSIGWVKVVRYNSHKETKRDNAYGVLIGEARCNY